MARSLGGGGGGSESDGVLVGENVIRSHLVPASCPKNHRRPMAKEAKAIGGEESPSDHRSRPAGQATGALAGTRSTTPTPGAQTSTARPNFVVTWSPDALGINRLNRLRERGGFSGLATIPVPEDAYTPFQGEAHRLVLETEPAGVGSDEPKPMTPIATPPDASTPTATATPTPHTPCPVAGAGGGPHDLTRPEQPTAAATTARLRPPAIGEETLATAGAARFMRTMPLAELAGELAKRWPAASLTMSEKEAELLTPADKAMRAAAVVFAEALHRLRVPSWSPATAPRLHAAATEALMLLAGSGVDDMGPHAAAQILRPVLEAATKEDWKPEHGLTPPLVEAIGAEAAKHDTLGPIPRPTERRGQHPSEGAAPQGDEQQ